MSYYFGYFRSKDTTTDSNGQLYKVEISTDVKNSGEYPRKKIAIGQYIPDNGIELTLSDNPFSVSYEGDDSNIYKPYKCSTASIGIILDTFNPDLISTGKNDIYVKLLKWDNDIYRDGDSYKRKSTGETVCSITTITYQTYYYHSFKPSDLAKCYTVEWVGYATPNTFNQNYSSIFDEYTLECQDIISTFKYYDYSISDSLFSSSTDNHLISIKEVFRNMKNLLPEFPFNEYYITNSIRYTNTDNSSVDRNVYCINSNWIDEDNEGTDYLSIIAEYCRMINCTLIQWKDKLLFINPDSISKYRNTYIKNNIISSTTSEIDIIDVKDISECDSASNGTNISTTSTYKKVELTTDEYTIDEYVWNLDDDERYEIFYNWDLIVNFEKITDTHRIILSNNYPYVYEYDSALGKSVYSGSLVRQKTTISNENNSTIQCYHYPKDTYNSTTNYLEWNTSVNNRISGSISNYGDLINYQGCTIAEYSTDEIDSSTATNDILMKSYSGSRCFLFHSPYSWLYEYGYIVPPNVNENNFTNSNQDGNIMLSITTKNLYIDSSQALQLKGNVEFFATEFAYPVSAGWNKDILLAFYDYMYMWVKVKIITNTGNSKYLHFNETTNKYEWLDNNCWCKLWYNGDTLLDKEINKRNKGNTTTTAFETKFSFTKNTRGQEGSCIVFPDDVNEYGKLEISFAKPFGCATERKVAGVQQKFYQPQSTILSGFEVNVVSAESLNYRYDKDSFKDNNKWKQKIEDNAIDDYSSLSCKLSTSESKVCNYSTIYDKDSVRVKRIVNTNTYKNYPPESNIIDGIAGTYKTPNIILNTEIHNEVSPITLFTWNTQLPNRYFVVDTLNIDYSKEVRSMRLMEKKYSSPDESVVITNEVRNYRRNGDNLYSELPYQNKRTVDIPEEDETAKQNIQYQTTNGDSYVITDGNPLIKDMVLECTLYDGNGNIIIPDYLDEDITYTINNGEITINY